MAEICIAISHATMPRVLHADLHQDQDISLLLVGFLPS